MMHGQRNIKLKKNIVSVASRSLHKIHIPPFYYPAYLDNVS